MAEPAEKVSATRRSLFALLAVFVVPVSLAALFFHLDSFQPASLPLHELAGPVAVAPVRNERMLDGAEHVGAGELPAPEDLAYDAEDGVVYTGCHDGWVKRVTLNDSVADSVVENWVNTGGRPLGLILGRGEKLFVADTDKGLLSISKDGVIRVLSDEADGVKFKLTDCVDEAEDGTIYFTDASHKYGLDEFIWDMLEGRPHGRLLSYDPHTETTRVLLRDLNFPNGVIVSPDQASLIFCETLMRRCARYHLKGEKKGRVEGFIENLPGMPDNIRYDGHGMYWIALATEPTPEWELAFKYPAVRKILAILERYSLRPNMERNGGVFAVDLVGKPIAHYSDPAISYVSTGVKIGDHLYCGSVFASHILRLNLRQYPAHASA